MAIIKVEYTSGMYVKTGNGMEKTTALQMCGMTLTATARNL